MNFPEEQAMTSASAAFKSHHQEPLLLTILLYYYIYYTTTTTNSLTKLQSNKIEYATKRNNSAQCVLEHLAHLDSSDDGSLATDDDSLTNNDAY